MTRGIGAALLAAVVLAGCGVETRPSDRPDGSEEALADGRTMVEAEVTALIERYTAATAIRDTAAIRRYVLDDPRFVWFEEGEPRYRSADEILASLAMFPPEQSIETTLGEVRVVPVGEGGAMAWTDYETVVGDGAFRFGGLIVFVLERGPDGWRIVGGQAS